MARLDLRKVKHVSRFDLAEKLGDKPLTIGRASDSDVVLTDTHVSRKHCVIEVIEGETRIRDLKSHGGTFVNGRKVQQATLHHGDRISIGPFDLLFKDPATAHLTNGDLPLTISNEDTGHQLEGDSSRSATGLRLAASASAAIDPDLESRRADLELREAKLQEREANLQALKAELDQKRTSALKQDAERIASLQKELDRARSDALIASDRISALNDQVGAHDRIVEDLRSQISDLATAHEQATAAKDESTGVLANLREQVAQLQAQVSEQDARVVELQGAIKSRQEQLDQLETRSKEQVRSLEQAIGGSQCEIERLKAHEATLQEQVEALETSRRIMAERAELSNRTLATLRGQVRSLDDAAQRVSAIQSRLTEIESAFVDLEQQMESAQEQDDEQLERAATQRQQISDELEALNEVRDAAVAQLSQSAQHLRVVTDQQLLQIATARPMPRIEQSSARSTSAGEPGGRRWWKFGR